MVVVQAVVVVVMMMMMVVVMLVVLVVLLVVVVMLCGGGVGSSGGDASGGGDHLTTREHLLEAISGLPPSRQRLQWRRAGQRGWLGGCWATGDVGGVSSSSVSEWDRRRSRRS